MPLIPVSLKQQLFENGRTNWKLSEQDKETTDFRPVVKLFDPCGAGTWLLTELAPEDEDLAFGLYDLGTGFPELGSVRISELESYKRPLGIGIERDLHFEADKTLSAYAEAARINERASKHRGTVTCGLRAGTRQPGGPRSPFLSCGPRSSFVEQIIDFGPRIQKSRTVPRKFLAV